MGNAVIGLDEDSPIELCDRLGLTSCWKVVRNNSGSWIGRAGKAERQLRSAGRGMGSKYLERVEQVSFA